MNLTAYFLKFDGPLHIGDHKPFTYESSEVFLRSDTIIAAIIATWAKYGQDEFIGDGKLPFKISSAFPYFINEKVPVPLFPRPKLAFDFPDSDSSYSKKIKKIQWMDKACFESQINGRTINNWKDMLHGDTLSEVNPKKFMTKQVSERVQIPRDRSVAESEPFYMERIYFNDGGLYFLAQGEHLDRLEKALNMLSDDGFGTDRNVGNGFFVWTKETLNIDYPEKASHCTNLGLYLPQKEDIKDIMDDDSTYDTIRRGGWITTEGYLGIEKKSVTMLAEGSVFRSKQNLSGISNIDLRPSSYTVNHPIYRCGDPIFIPIKI
jgi:CRISPR type III-A-associated RAMP protein Csm4